MENPLLNSGDTVQQTIQPANSKQSFIHSRTYGPKQTPSCGSNMKFSYSRKCGINETGMHLEHANRQDVILTSNADQVQRFDFAQSRNHNFGHGHEQLQVQLHEQSYGHGDSLATTHGRAPLLSATGSPVAGHLPLIYRHCAEFQPDGLANINSAPGVYNVRSWTDWETQQQQQQQHQLAQQRQHLQQQQQQVLDAALSQSRTHSLNVSAPSFTPARARDGINGLAASRLAMHLMPSQSQPQLPSQPPSSSRHPAERSSGSRRQQLPDLFQTVIRLMRELNRSVSYPEMIGMLSIRLQRLPVELKRHIPHTLHGAVANGYLRKDGNYYTLLSEQEQKEIMKRNQEAAQRAKELEKEPLSWRIR